MAIPSLCNPATFMVDSVCLLSPVSLIPRSMGLPMNRVRPAVVGDVRPSPNSLLIRIGHKAMPTHNGAAFGE